ncbi:V-snare-domain-containing protein [Hyphopichia burtonii NRRL Y-1933]|uniref:V-snare-domain-containing protein n=1 Tax=Hyphopichia burtonii NRRL Y-1933 TaxID=984485 RepID=A0A1E4RJ83_9ASCO|nr:V-snare-domain-containing protein [Hyphopichia burtonii NRRL Y-1933]ODV67281.1 V-snare-domain-containing protein [Hyphopichia burtonii NRRL Y-1933]
MADLFESYESDLQLALQEAKTKLSQISSADPEQRKASLKAIENATDEALEVLDQMNIEVQNLPSNQRSSFNSKIRQYKNQVEQSKSQLKRLLDDQDRNELFGSRYTDGDEELGGDDLRGSQRKQLLSNNASLERSSERLRDSQRVALETETIGGNILDDLRAQREQISYSRNTLSNADNYVDKSIQTLKSMSRRITANKFISYAIIAVLILLIFLVLASKFW